MVQRVAAVGAGSPAPEPAPVRVSSLQVAKAVGGSFRDRYFPNLGSTAAGQEPGIVARVVNFFFGKPIDPTTPEGERRLLNRADVLRGRISDLESTARRLEEQETRLKARGRELAALERDLNEKLAKNLATDGQLAEELEAIRVEMREVDAEFQGVGQQRYLLRVEYGALDVARGQIEGMLAKAPDTAQNADLLVQLDEVHEKLAQVRTDDIVAQRQEVEIMGRKDRLESKARQVEERREKLKEARKEIKVELRAVRHERVAVEVELKSVGRQLTEVRADIDRARKEYDAAMREYERRRAARQAEERRLEEVAYQERKDFEKKALEKDLEKKRLERDYEARQVASVQEARRHGDRSVEAVRLEAAYVAARAQAARQQAFPAAERQALAVALLAVDRISTPLPGAEKHQIVDNSSIERRKLKREVVGI